MFTIIFQVVTTLMAIAGILLSVFMAIKLRKSLHLYLFQLFSILVPNVMISLIVIGLHPTFVHTESSIGFTVDIFGYQHQSLVYTVIPIVFIFSMKPMLYLVRYFDIRLLSKNSVFAMSTMWKVIRVLCPLVMVVGVSFFEVFIRVFDKTVTEKTKQETILTELSVFWIALMVSLMAVAAISLGLLELHIPIKTVKNNIAPHRKFRRSLYVEAIVELLVLWFPMILIPILTKLGLYYEIYLYYLTIAIAILPSINALICIKLLRSKNAVVQILTKEEREAGAATIIYHCQINGKVY